MPADLRRVVRAAAWVLLDFDGPVCGVFAGHPAADVADRLRRLLTDALDDPLPDDVRTTRDPLHVLRRAAELAPGPDRTGGAGGGLVAAVDAELRAAELTAVRTATPTPGAAEFLHACRTSGRPVAIVSNNAAQAVEAYLSRWSLAGLVRHVQGRDADPARMKPAPDPLLAALAVLGADPASAVLIGDSRADLDAARAAGVPVVAYANRPPKRTTLADADAVTDSVQALADALTD